MIWSSQNTQHRPLHLQLEGSWYFLTAHTIHNQQIFHDEVRMQILKEVIIHAQKLFKVKIFGYILWPDHYHMIFQLNEPTLHQFINNIHTYSSRLVNKLDEKKGRQVWYQYWDRFLRIQYTLDDLYHHVSYILHNPVKHGWCKTFNDAIAYPWSSIPQWAQKHGKEGLSECWTRYPVTDWSE